MTDLLGLKQQFTSLVQLAHPWILSHFVMWLDLKIAEYKVHGYMVLDQTATTSSRQQAASSEAPVRVVVDDATSSHSQACRQKQLYQQMISQLQEPRSGAIAASPSSSSPRGSSQRVGCCSPSQSGGSRSLSQLSSPNQLSGSQHSQPSPNHFSDGGILGRHTTLRIPGSRADCSLQVTHGNIVGGRMQGEIPASTRGEVYVDGSRDSSHLTPPGQVFPSSASFTSVRNPPVLSQPTPVSLYSRSSFNRMHRSSWTKFTQKWKTANRRPLSRAGGVSVNGLRNAQQEFPAATQSGSPLAASRSVVTSEKEASQRQRNFQAGLGGTEGDSAIVIDDDPKEDRKPTDRSSPPETVTESSHGKESVVNGAIADANTDSQGATQSSGISVLVEEALADNADAGKGSSDAGLSASVMDALQTDDQQPSWLQQISESITTSTPSSLGVTNTDLQDINTSVSVPDLSLSSTIPPEKWAAQAEDEWTSGIVQKPIMAKDAGIPSIKLEPESLDYEQSQEPGGQRSLSSTILENLLAYSEPVQASESFRLPGVAAPSSAEPPRGPWQIENVVSISQPQTFHSNPAQEPSFSASPVKKFSNISLRRSFPKTSAVLSSEGITCNICGASFRFRSGCSHQCHCLCAGAENVPDGRSSLSRHRMLHGEKRFHCFVCSKAYHRKEHLVLHLNRHHEKSVATRCPICQQQQPSLRLLEDHFHYHHGPLLAGRTGLYGGQLLLGRPPWGYS